MAAKRTTQRRTDPVLTYLDSLTSPETRDDSLTLIKLMREITGHAPRLLNVGTIGFDSYHYRYDSGREGDCHALGFYPRDGKTTVYLMDGTARHAALLKKLGKHTATRVCLSFKRLQDLSLPVLEELLRASYGYLKAQDGHMHRVRSTETRRAAGRKVPAKSKRPAARR